MFSFKLCWRASAASPNITGQIGCSPGQDIEALLGHAARNSAVLRRSALCCSRLPATRSSAVSDPATTIGATALENRYGRGLAAAVRRSRPGR